MWWKPEQNQEWILDLHQTINTNIQINEYVAVTVFVNTTFAISNLMRRHFTFDYQQSDLFLIMYKHNVHCMIFLLDYSIIMHSYLCDYSESRVTHDNTQNTGAVSFMAQGHTKPRWFLSAQAYCIVWGDVKEESYI